MKNSRGLFFERSLTSRVDSCHAVFVNESYWIWGYPKMTTWLRNGGSAKGLYEPRSKSCTMYCHQRVKWNLKKQSEINRKIISQTSINGVLPGVIALQSLIAVPTNPTQEHATSKTNPSERFKTWILQPYIMFLPSTLFQLRGAII